PFVVGNPYAGSEMHNVSVEVEGLLSQYLRVEPNFIKQIPKDGSYPTEVIITAPAYFSEGKHTLTFTIKSTVIKGVVRTKSTETTQVVLRVHEISTEDAEGLLSSAEGLVKKLKDAGLYFADVENLGRQMEVFLTDGEYKSVQELNQQIETLVENAFIAKEKIPEIDERIKLARQQGARVLESTRLINIAKAAFQRGDFNSAVERLKEAELTYLIETKGYFNIIYFVKSNLRTLIFGSIAGIFASIFAFLYGEYAIINYELNKRGREEAVLLGLMKAVQKECFEEKKMSMSEYSEAMLQYEKKLTGVVQRIVELESTKSNILKFGRDEARLKHESGRLMEMIKNTQKRYIEKGDLETRIYEDKMKSFTGRLGEVEEKLALIEAQKELKKRGGTFKVLFKKGAAGKK
ncbi:TPA: hypothetical protein H1012_01485, partial [archaeon]|nr:hypothetical protein [Candidatus Naiadarchaeales archaeon SRR2090159.bin1288]